MSWTGRMLSWVQRYAPAEVVAIAGAFLGSAATRAALDNPIAVAYGATAGEMLGFYCAMGVRELFGDGSTKLTMRAALRAPLQLRRLSGTARSLLIEFGPAEVVDTAVVRPALMATAMSHLGWEWGVPVGKVAADVVFYAMAITSYELRRRWNPVPRQRANSSEPLPDDG